MLGFEIRGFIKTLTTLRITEVENANATMGAERLQVDPTAICAAIRRYQKAENV